MNKSKIIIKNFGYFFILMFFASCNEETKYINPEIKNITESVYASGIIKSKNQYEVFSKINGIVAKVVLTEGSAVRKGDTIIQIYNESSKLAFKNARLNSVYSDYNFNLEKVNEAEKAIKLAKQKLTNDSLLFVRQKNLWEKGIGIKIELEQKELNYENSKLNLTSSITKYNDLKNQLQLISKQSKNNLEISKLLESDFYVKSEIDGVIYQIYKEKGEIVNNLSPIAIIGADDFEIELSVDEYDITKIKKDQTVFVRMDSYKNQVFEAKITSIDHIMNAKTRTFKAVAGFVDRPKVLYPNLTTECNILIQTKENVLIIERDYLLNDSTVMLESGKMQKVKIGLLDYNKVEIINGLSKSSKIIKQGK